MVVTVAERWRALALRGLAAVLFGLLAILWPAITLLILVWLFAGYSIVDGIFSILTGLRREPGRGRDWFLVALGMAGIAAGVVAILWPGITALVLVAIIAAWAIVTGILEIVAAARGGERQGRWLLMLAGVASAIFGGILIIFPGAGALALVLVIGAYAIASGILLLIAAYRLRSARHIGTVAA